MNITEEAFLEDYYYRSQPREFYVHPRWNKENKPFPFTLRWDPYGSDSYKAWQRVLAGKESILSKYKSQVKDTNLDRFIEHYTSNPVIYHLNSEGFRDYEFTSKPSEVDLYLGCSFTFGIGINLEDTWVHKLSLKLKFPSINAATPGSGPMTQFRVFMHFLQRFKIRNLFLYSPISHVRYEWLDWDTQFNKNAHKLWSPTSTDKFPGDLNYVLSLDGNLSLMQYTFFNAFKNICKDKNINCNIISSDIPSAVVVKDVYAHEFLGRDLGHPGPKQQDYIANVFYKKFFEKVANVL